MVQSHSTRTHDYIGVKFPEQRLGIRTESVPHKTLLIRRIGPEVKDILCPWSEETHSVATDKGMQPEGNNKKHCLSSKGATAKLK